MYRNIFLDANILADIYDESRPYCKSSREAVSYLLSQEKIELFTSCDIITTIYYIYSKKDRHKALDQVIEINEWCKVVEFGNSEVTKSCRLMKQNKKFKDLEDTIQYVMAKKVGADLILSNDKGFVSDGIELTSTNEFVKNMKE
ncbi:MAG: PIN domain-containing protein [Campylobacterota bacterium]|nr:PIN domain-containing protein [Campylobacterota bacterium]